MSAKEILSRYNVECFFVFVFCFCSFLSTLEMVHS